MKDDSILFWDHPLIDPFINFPEKLLFPRSQIRTRTFVIISVGKNLLFLEKCTKSMLPY